jgi:hypothetical protein
VDDLLILYRIVIKVRAMRSLLFHIAEAAGSCGCGIIPVAISSASFVSRTVAIRVFQASQLPSLNFSILGDEVDTLRLLLLATMGAEDNWDAVPPDVSGGGSGMCGGGPNGSGGCAEVDIA